MGLQHAWGSASVPEDARRSADAPSSRVRQRDLAPEPMAVGPGSVLGEGRVDRDGVVHGRHAELVPGEAVRGAVYLDGRVER